MVGENTSVQDEYNVHADAVVDQYGMFRIVEASKVQEYLEVLGIIVGTNMSACRCACMDELCAHIIGCAKVVHTGATGYSNANDRES